MQPRTGLLGGPYNRSAHEQTCGLWNPRVRPAQQHSWWIDHIMRVKRSHQSSHPCETLCHLQRPPMCRTYAKRPLLPVSACGPPASHSQHFTVKAAQHDGVNCIAGRKNVLLLPGGRHGKNFSVACWSGSPDNGEVVLQYIITSYPWRWQEGRREWVTSLRQHLALCCVSPAAASRGAIPAESYPPAS